MLFDGAEFGHAGEVHVGSEEEMDFLGIPGLLEPDQVRELLHQRQSDRPRRSGRPAPDRRSRAAPHEQLAMLRRELNGLVAAWHHRTGQPHGVTHAALRKECGGPAAAVASADQLHARINRLREWAVRARAPDACRSSHPERWRCGPGGERNSLGRWCPRRRRLSTAGAECSWLSRRSRTDSR